MFVWLVVLFFLFDFLKKGLSESNELIKSVFQNYHYPAFKLLKGLANKDYQENKNHDNFTSNCHDEKLNTDESETTVRMMFG